MATPLEPDIILYDLACTKGVCFSPVVWRIRMMLNYKRISYQTIFLEFPDIEPTLKSLGISPNESASNNRVYTVPTIHHVPSGKLIMDSTPISQFLETTYPEPSLTLTSELGARIESDGRRSISGALRVSIMPREINILSPRAQEYFRRTREATLGHPLEDLLLGDKEEQSWKESEDALRAVGQLLLTNSAHGPFVFGAQPSYTDFFIAGVLRCARVVDEGVFQRHISYPGYKEIYEACLPYMEKKD